MSLTADIAGAIVAVDEAFKLFELGTPRAVIESPVYKRLKDRVEDMMDTSLGEGMHFDSLEEARAYRAQPVVMCPPGTRWCVGGCGNFLPVEDGFRCIACS